MTSTVSVPTAKPALSTSLRVLFRMLTRGAAEGVLELMQHGGRGYTGGAAVSTPFLGIQDVVLHILETSVSPWGVGLAARRSRGGPPASISALAVRRAFERVYINPSTPESDSGRRWVFPERDIAKWEASLEAGPLPPTMTIRALPLVVALWSLAEPLPAATSKEQARVLDLLRSLALAVEGAELPATLALADVEIPLVGTRCANQDQRVVWCPALAVGRVYEVAAVEAAIKGRK